MIKVIKIILISLIVFTFSIPCYGKTTRGITVRPKAPTGEEIAGNQWLFVIGINSYIEWPRLKTAVNDAKAVRDVLLSRYYFHKEHLIELYDEQATRQNIIGKLRYLAENVKKDDSLLVYYAGHGHLDTITKAGSWIPVESGIEDASDWISNHDIKNYLKVDAIKAKHILLISDSCFSGDFFRGQRGKLPKVTDEVIKEAYCLTSRQAITSGGLEPVSDEGFGRNSVFSHFLVKTLEENQKLFLVPTDFFPDIKAGVVENAEQFPRIGSLTGTGGQQGGELVLFLKQESRLEDISAKKSAKMEEFARLKQLEEEEEIAKKEEHAEIARQEKEVAELDNRIQEMRKRLNTPLALENDSLDSMLAMVQQKEEQQRRIEELRKKRQEEETKRRAEIARLKREKKEKLIAALKEDIRKYEKIVSSPFGKDMKADAWAALAAKYPDAAEGLEVGETDLLIAGVKDEGRKPGETWREPRTGVELVWVPSGCYEMGSNSGDSDEKPVHEVCVDGFWIGKYEVTQGQWKRVMGNNPSRFKKGDNYPVERVSWNDVKAFIQKLNSMNSGQFDLRLPTEVEWEYAARSGGKNENTQVVGILIMSRGMMATAVAPPILWAPSLRTG